MCQENLSLALLVLIWFCVYNYWDQQILGRKNKRAIFMELLDQITYYSQFIRDYGYIVMLILSAAIIIQCIIPTIPFGLVAGMCGFLFGFFPGLLLALVSVAIGSLVAVNIYRFFNLGKFAAKILARYKIVPKLSDKIIVGFLVVVHNIPVIPIAVANIVAAISNISRVKFIIATVIGLLVPSILFVGFGAGIEAFLRNPGIITFLPILFISGFLILLRYIDLNKTLSIFD